MAFERTQPRPIHFLLDNDLSTEENLANLNAMRPNDYRKLLTTKIQEKKVYRVAFIGEQGVGKSSVLNYLFSVWSKSPSCIPRAPVGTKEFPGTRCFDGPYEFITTSGNAFLEIYDGMGYFARDASPEEEWIVRRELIGIATGTVKPGFVRYNNHGAFKPVERKEFPGVDIFVIFAEHDKSEQVVRALNMREYLIQNYIPCYLVLTKPKTDSTNSELVNSEIPHISINSPKSGETIPADSSRAIQLLKTIVYEIENRTETERDLSITRSMIDNYSAAKHWYSLHFNTQRLVYALFVLVIAFLLYERFF